MRFAGAYYLYTGVAVVGLAFFWWVLPETRGRKLEEVEELFAAPWLSAQRPSAAPLPPAEYERLGEAAPDSLMSDSDASLS